MRVRHKVPSLFTLSMVDVLCCALGCVILMWLLNARQADEADEEHRQELAEVLAKGQSERDQIESRVRGENDRLNRSLQQMVIDREKAARLQARLEVQIRSMQDARVALESQLKGEQGLAEDLQKKLKNSMSQMVRLEGDVKDRAALLAGERKRAGALADRLAAFEAQLKKVNRELDLARASHRTDQSRADALMKAIDDRQRELTAVNRRLSGATAALGNLEKALSQRDKELAAAQVFKDRARIAEDRERFLAKQLGDRQAAMTAATRTLAALEKEKRSLQAAAENRFAGITLTGRRVVFLVDMSGSMGFLDEKTPAPDKWVEVRSTVARLMQSLPELEKYQVITFAEKASFPLGAAGKWLTHDAKTSPKKVLETLAAVKPDGGTNMYAALDAAFRYRADGLDTIYLLSDGLPNLGEGLSAEQERALKDNEVERGAVLGKYVRRTLATSWNRRLATQPRVRINTIGFFYESPDLGAFLWALSRENDGSFVGMSKP